MSSPLATLAWVIVRGIAVTVFAFAISVLAGIGILVLVNADTLAEVGFGSALLMGGGVFFVGLISGAHVGHTPPRSTPK